MAVANDTGRRLIGHRHYRGSSFRHPARRRSLVRSRPARDVEVAIGVWRQPADAQHRRRGSSQLLRTYNRSRHISTNGPRPRQTTTLTSSVHRRQTDVAYGVGIRSARFEGCAGQVGRGSRAQLTGAREPPYQTQIQRSVSDAAASERHYRTKQLLLGWSPRGRNSPVKAGKSRKPPWRGLWGISTIVATTIRRSVEAKAESGESLHEKQLPGAQAGAFSRPLPKSVLACAAIGVGPLNVPVPVAIRKQAHADIRKWNTAEPPVTLRSAPVSRRRGSSDGGHLEVKCRRHQQ